MLVQLELPNQVKVAINRPNFLPWLGFMAILDSVDVFIVLDEILASTRNYLARNQIKDKYGVAQWISQSKHKASIHTRVCDLELKVDDNWREKLINKINDYYKKAPYFNLYSDQVFVALKNQEKSLLKYNVSLLESLCDLLGIKTQFLFASDLLDRDYDNAEDRMIDLCIKANASGYYNPRDGIEKGLYKAEKFIENDMALYKQIYRHPEYPQINGDFIPYMSVIDVLFNCGKASLPIIKSGNTWEEQ